MNRALVVMGAIVFMAVLLGIDWRGLLAAVVLIGSGIIGIGFILGLFNPAGGRFNPVGGILGLLFIVGILPIAALGIKASISDSFRLIMPNTEAVNWWLAIPAALAAGGVYLGREKAPWPWNNVLIYIVLPVSALTLAFCLWPLISWFTALLVVAGLLVLGGYMLIRVSVPREEANTQHGNNRRGGGGYRRVYPGDPDNREKRMRDLFDSLREEKHE